MFLIPHVVAQERGYPPVEDQLAEEVARLAREIADSVGAKRAALDRELLNEQLRLATRALRRWDYTRLFLDEDPKADVVLTLRPPRGSVDF
jgi:hypothetical protein